MRSSSRASRFVQGQTLIVDGAAFDVVEWATKLICHLLAHIQWLRVGNPGSSRLDVDQLFDVIEPLDPTYEKNARINGRYTLEDNDYEYHLGVPSCKGRYKGLLSGFHFDIFVLLHLRMNNDPSDRITSEKFLPTTTFGRTLLASFAGDFDSYEGFAKYLGRAGAITSQRKRKNLWELSIISVSASVCAVAREDFLDLARLQLKVLECHSFFVNARKYRIITSYTRYIHGFMHGEILSDELREIIGQLESCRE